MFRAPTTIPNFHLVEVNDKGSEIVLRSMYHANNAIRIKNTDEFEHTYQVAAAYLYGMGWGVEGYCHSFDGKHYLLCTTWSKLDGVVEAETINLFEKVLGRLQAEGISGENYSFEKAINSLMVCALPIPLIKCFVNNHLLFIEALKQK